MSKLESFFGRPVGIFNWIYPGDSAAQAKAIADQGFSCVQWGVYPRDTREISENEAKETTRLYQEHGLPIVVLSGYQNIVATAPEKKALALENLDHFLEISPLFPDSVGVATETGTKNPDSQWNDHPTNTEPTVWDEMVTSLLALGEKAKQAGTRLLIEGYVENVCRTPEDIERLLPLLDPKVFGFMMDPFNLVLEEKVPQLSDEISRIFTLIGEHSPIAHAKDLLYTDGVVSTPRSGTGIFDFATYFRLLDEKMPGVPLILEHLEAGQVEETLDFLKREYDRYRSAAAT